MNEEIHWNNIGTSYNGEIFDVFKSDKEKKLTRYFNKHADRSKLAIDFGCGTGKSFPYLAPSFREVLAIDISGELLNIAKSNRYHNITYKKADLTSNRLNFPRADFVFCCNVIMLPEPEKNHRMIKNVYKALRDNGSSLIVVPSLESVLFATRRLMDWYKKEGIDPDGIPSSELSYYKGNKREILQGIIYIDNVPTKHYMETEIRVLFNEANLDITAIEKLEYDWDSELIDPPSWMSAPYPWDWLIECRKTK